MLPCSQWLAIASVVWGVFPRRGICFTNTENTLSICILLLQASKGKLDLGGEHLLLWCLWLLVWLRVVFLPLCTCAVRQTDTERESDAIQTHTLAHRHWYRHKQGSHFRLFHTVAGEGKKERVEWSKSGVEKKNKHKWNKRTISGQCNWIKSKFMNWIEELFSGLLGSFTQGVSSGYSTHTNDITFGTFDSIELLAKAANDIWHWFTLVSFFFKQSAVLTSNWTTRCLCHSSESIKETMVPVFSGYFFDTKASCANREVNIKKSSRWHSSPQARRIHSSHASTYHCPSIHTQTFIQTRITNQSIPSALATQGKHRIQEISLEVLCFYAFCCRAKKTTNSLLFLLFTLITFFSVVSVTWLRAEIDGDWDGMDGMGMMDGWTDILCVYVCESVPVTTCNTMHTVVLAHGTTLDIWDMHWARTSEEVRKRARVGGKGRKQNGQGRSFFFFCPIFLQKLNRVLIAIECRRVSFSSLSPLLFSTFSSCCLCWQ